MALDPLHQNSGRMRRTWRIGRLYVMVAIAEDPAKPPLRRCWSHQDPERKTQRDMFLACMRVTHEGDDGRRQDVCNIIIGPVAVWLALLPQRDGRPRKSRL